MYKLYPSFLWEKYTEILKVEQAKTEQLKWEQPHVHRSRITFWWSAKNKKEERKKGLFVLEDLHIHISVQPNLVIFYGNTSVDSSIYIFCKLL